MNKAPDAFRTISEVAEDLDLPQHVLRFWESRFPQIRPMKRGGGRRYYRPEDVDLLRGIRHLLYGEGYTIRGVQRILREQGLRTVQSVGQGRPVALPGPARDDATDLDDSSDAEDSGDAEEPRDADSGPGLLKFLPARLSGALAREATDADKADAADDGGAGRARDEDDTHTRHGSAFAERTAGPPSNAPDRMAAEPGAAHDSARDAAALPEKLSNEADYEDAEAAPAAAVPPGALPNGPVAGLAPEDLDRLRTALLRLQECRQLLDQTHA